MSVSHTDSDHTLTASPNRATAIEFPKHYQHQPAVSLDVQVLKQVDVLIIFLIQKIYF